MKHWKPFKSGGLYTCMDCEINIDQQTAIKNLESELSAANETVRILQEICEANKISLENMFGIEN